MATLYESYNTGDDDVVALSGNNLRGQTFTPSTSHTIKSVKLKLYQIGTPGTLTVRIESTSGGLPTDTVLVSNTLDGTTLTTDTGGAFAEITLGAGYALSSGVTYAIVCSCDGADSSNCIRWRFDGSSPSYTGGSYVLKSGTWSADTGRDVMFEDWGDPANQNLTWSGDDTVRITESNTNSRQRVSTVSDTMQMTEVNTNPRARFSNNIDTITLTDIAIAAKGWIISVIDTIKITDTFDAIRLKIIEVFDTINLTESLISARSRIISVIDSINITENISAIKLSIIDAYDTIRMTDIDGIIRIKLIEVSDTIKLTETMSAMKEFIISVSDTIKLTESISSLKITIISVFDRIRITENVRADMMRICKGMLRMDSKQQSYPNTLNDTNNNKMNSNQQTYPVPMDEDVK